MDVTTLIDEEGMGGVGGGECDMDAICLPVVAVAQLSLMAHPVCRDTPCSYGHGPV